MAELVHLEIERVSPELDAIPRWDGIAQHWSPGPVLSGSVVRAAAFAGADLGAMINAADAALGSSPGEILVDRSVSTTISTAVVLTNGHTLRFLVGGPYICTAGFTLEQGCSIIGHGGLASYSSVSTGTVLVHNFNGDFIVYSGASSDIGGQGGGRLENLTLWNSYTGGDLSGNAIKITGSSTSLRAGWILIRRCNTDGGNASYRWTRSLLIDGSPVGGSNGVRDFWVDTCRFASCGTDNEDILVKNAFNVFLRNVITNNSNNGAQTIGITIAGTSGNVSSGVLLTDVDCGNYVQDWANNAVVLGGSYSSATYGSNCLGKNIFLPGRLEGAFTNGSGANVWGQFYNGSELEIVSAGLPSSAGASAGVYLPIKYNGTQYKIALLGYT